MAELRKYRYCGVNLCLAAVQAVIFELCVLTGSRWYLWGRCGTDLVLRDGQYWRLLTSVFLHADIRHLGSNLLVQILLGNPVERNIGHVKYLALYLLSGIGGNIVSVLYDSALGVNTYSVGASGAVFGVIGVLILLIVKGRKKLRRGSSLLARAAFAVFFSIYSGFRNPYTDNAAHLGGLAAGVLLGLLLTLGMEDVDLRDLR